jgi:hypothetical protein
MIGSINFKLYQQIAQTTSRVNSFINEAMLLKSQLSMIPLMDSGVGEKVNIVI